MRTHGFSRAWVRHEFVQRSAAFHTLVESVGTVVANISVSTREHDRITIFNVKFLEADQAMKLCRGKELCSAAEEMF